MSLYVNILINLMEKTLTFAIQTYNLWIRSKMFKLLSRDLLKSSKIRDTFPEEKDYEIGFSDHYNKYLKDKVERFEENRISTLKEARNV